MPGCYIIDDELHAVELLSDYILQTPGLELVGAATDPVKGLHEVIERIPDILFLDIDMPKLSGIDLLGMLDGSQIVIFITAHTQYAVNAFNINADYLLLKPIRYSRFVACLEKIAEKRTDI